MKTTVSLGSLCGAAVTFYIGRRLGEPGLEHFVSKGRLDSIRRQIEDKGAIALAVLDLIPPPFPFTACILAAGALEVSTPLFFLTLEATRFCDSASRPYWHSFTESRLSAGCNRQLSNISASAFSFLPWWEQ